MGRREDRKMRGVIENGERGRGIRIGRRVKEKGEFNLALTENN